MAMAGASTTGRHGSWSESGTRHAIFNVRAFSVGRRILLTQTVPSGPFVSRAEYILHRGSVRLGDTRSGATHPVPRFMADDGQYLIDVGYAAK
jgi:hypothetical protein